MIYKQPNEYERGRIDGMLESMEEAKREYLKDRAKSSDDEALGIYYIEGMAMGALFTEAAIRKRLVEVERSIEVKKELAASKRLIEAEGLLGPILYGGFRITLDSMADGSDVAFDSVSITAGIRKRAEEVKAYFKKYGEKT